ncbi:MAG: bstEII [Rhodoferax sp.]
MMSLQQVRGVLMRKLFGDYKGQAAKYITTQDRPYYPDYLEDARILYRDVFKMFGVLLNSASSSSDLLLKIHEQSGDLRIQLLRCFRKYVSPMTSVEMLKIKTKVSLVISDFGDSFRALEQVRSRYRERVFDDEALAAILWEHHDRGTPGYILTKAFFDAFELKFGDEYTIAGPREAGADVQLSGILPKFTSIVPADFVVLRKDSDIPLVVGFAHYDSDRGGSQEDDRTGGNQDKVEKIMAYAARRRLPMQVLFVNDGPGLLLGSMWDDYARLETNNVVDDELRVMVVTLKMVSKRLTVDWLEGRH